MLPDIRTCTNLSGARVVLRAGLNVPIRDGIIQNDFRIRRALPTITYLREQGAKIVIVAHIGRDTDDTLEPVAEYLKDHFAVTFAPNIETAHQEMEAAHPGHIILLENVRQDARERANNNAYAQELAALGDIYVNDAFADSHRAHASVVGIPNYLPAYAGIQFLNEVTHAEQARQPARPAVGIFGGAKFETKVPVIQALKEQYDTIFICGALANAVFQARGYEVGRSLVPDDADISKLLADTRIRVPVDVVVEHANGESDVVASDAVGINDKIVDAGPETIAEMRTVFKKAASILWNGPLGVYEGGYDTYTNALAVAIGEQNAIALAGGGDTVAAICESEQLAGFDFVSTAGGALLTYLADGTLPGIVALQQSRE